MEALFNDRNNCFYGSSGIDRFVCIAVKVFSQLVFSAEFLSCCLYQLLDLSFDFKIGQGILSQRTAKLVRHNHAGGGNVFLPCAFLQNHKFNFKSRRRRISSAQKPEFSDADPLCVDGIALFRCDRIFYLRLPPVLENQQNGVFFKKSCPQNADFYRYH